jgi:cholesterol transport system auxiliary component
MLSLLTACSSILPKRGEAPDIYQLSPVALETAPKAVPAQLIVDVPLASRGLDTDRIVVRDNPYEIKYLAGVRWSDRAPRLMQSALIQGLESAGAFSAIGRPEDGIRSSYALLSDLRAFDVLGSGLMGRTKVQIVLAGKLVRPGGEVVSSRLISKEVDAKSAGERDIVAAFDEAVKSVATEATQWAVSSAGPDGKSAPSASVEPARPTATP